MLELRIVAILAIVIAFVASSSGCIDQVEKDLEDLNPWAEEEAKKEIDVEIIGHKQTVARGDNITLGVLVKNLKRDTYNASLSFKSMPKGFSGEFFNDTFKLLRSRQKGTLVTIHIGEEAKLGTFKLYIKAKFLEKTSISKKKKVKVTVLAPGEGDVRSGDMVDVDYIGFLDDGEVFDTSVADIGRNTNIPKSKEWQGHGDTYRPLNFIVGSGGVVKGFDESVMGLKIGQSRTILVTPDIGYAVLINHTVNKTDRVQMIQEMEWNQFVNVYGEVPAENKMVVDKYWGWTVQVLDLEGTNVTIMINPQGVMNSTLSPYGLDFRIISVDSLANDGLGEIVVEHTVVPGENVTYRGMNGDIAEETDTQIIITYNDSSNPLSNKNMWFHVTLVKIQVR